MYDPNCPLLTLDQILEARIVVQNSDLCIRTSMIEKSPESFGLPTSIHLFLKMEAAQNSGKT